MDDEHRLTPTPTEESASTRTVGHSAASLLRALILAPGLLLRFTVLLALLVVIVVTIRFASLPSETTFNVTAVTERLSFSIAREPPSRWILDSVRVADETGSRLFSGGFHAVAQTVVTLERIASGRLWVHVESDDLHRSAGRFFDTQDEAGDTAAASIDVFVDDVSARSQRGRPVLISLTGTVTLGREVGIETRGGAPAVLRNGRVGLLGHSIIGRRPVVARTEELVLGEVFSVDHQLAPALGFALASDGPGLGVAYRVVGEAGVVTRPGGGQFELYASPLDRLSSDSAVQRLGLILSIIAATLAFINQALEFRRRVWRPAQFSATS